MNHFQLISMKKKYLSTMCSTFALVTVSLMTLSVSHAYDTDIFLPIQSGDPTNHPNVVFVLDNSGSMAKTDNTSSSRIDKLKVAMNKVLENSTDVNIGFVVFTPVKNLPESERNRPFAESIAPISSINNQDVRAGLIKQVNGIAAKRATPLVDALFEAGMMLSGGAVRSSNGGTTQNNTNAPKKNRPTSLVRYPDPMIGQCQPNHIVVVSDGEPNGNNVRGHVEKLTGAKCAGGDDGECGVELASWLYNTNHKPGFARSKNITVHTLGFLTKNKFLPSLSQAGGGKHFQAERSEQLLDVFQEVLTTIKQEGASMGTPSLSIDQFNRLSQSEKVFVGMFEPQPNATWNGNLKQYKLGLDGNTVAILDASDAPAVDTDTGMFRSSARSIWSTSDDGNNVAKGGAASRLTSSRTLYTHLGDVSGGGVNLSTPLSLVAASALGVGDDQEKSDMLRWLNDIDVKDLDQDGNSSERRFHMGDVIHSTPVAINYAGGQSVVYVGTNEGFLHAIDGSSGREKYAFIPEELLGNLGKFYSSVGPFFRPFGLDGEISTLHIDENNNSLVDGADKAYLYVGMRRGGDNYYAFDITRPNNPKLMWRANGGDGDYARLGQTWSRPIPTKIHYQGTPRHVVIFGGGYDINNDPVNRRNSSPRNATDSVGNSLYIVDAVTGKRLWSADAHLNASGQMNHSIPANLRVIDINGDNFADIIYAGDLGGQVWRFDIKGFHQSGDGPKELVSGGVMARFGDVGNPAEFYNEPDVALLSLKGEQFLSVSIGSGWRAAPLDTSKRNRFYMFRDNSPMVKPERYGAQFDQRWRTITDSDLTDVSSSVSDTSSKIQNGWMLDLTGRGEKNLSRSTTINNQVIFTTYEPIASPDPCSPPSGRSHIYALNVFNGDPALPLSSGGPPGSVGSIPADRRTVLATKNIPAAPSGAIFQVDGDTYTGVLAGNESVLPNLPFSRLTKRTYWQDLRRGSMTPSDCRLSSSRDLICR